MAERDLPNWRTAASGGPDEPDYMKPPQSPFERSHGWVSTAEKLLVSCMVILVIGGALFVAWGAARIKVTTESTYENRAVSCRVLLALGQTLEEDGPCYEPEIRAYYDPTDLALWRTSNTEAICLILREMDVPERKVPANCPDLEDEDG